MSAMCCVDAAWLLLAGILVVCGMAIYLSAFGVHPALLLGSDGDE